MISGNNTKQSILDQNKNLPESGDERHRTYNLFASKVLQQFSDYHIRLLKVRARGKEAVEKNWQTVANYAISDSRIQDWILHGGNYGVTCPSGFCCMVDADNVDVQDALEDNLPQTFRYSTGKTGHFQYVYYIEDQPIGCVPLKDGAYIKGKGGYALGPGSVHPNGVIYGSKETREVPIAIVTNEDIMDTISPFLITKPALASVKPLITRKWNDNIDIPALIEILKPYWAKAAGMRNELTLSLAGFIARSGGTENQATQIIAELARLTGKGLDHIAGAKYAFQRDGPVKGFTSLDHVLEVIDGAQ
jgi:hypothetical protein